MYDIAFFRNATEIKNSIVDGNPGNQSNDEIFNRLEALRDKDPYLFNIEVTNNCNMTCKMCPRTSLMTREISSISDADFDNVLSQIKPHDSKDLDAFWSFIKDEYGIDKSQRSENSFYFNTVSRCVILHGYGESMIDPNIVKRVKTCTEKGIPTYFSCVPANVSVKRMVDLMEAGLSVIKFSVDALDDESQKAIRGNNNNFEKAFTTIKKIIDLKESNSDYKTELVVTMISLSDSEEKLHNDFMALWEDYPVFAYIKSQDNRWYYKKNSNYVSHSHYEMHYCEYPWTSLSVMANGDVVPCTQDYNCEMRMGNVREQTLKEIWNGEKYADFRKAHITGNFEERYACNKRCDYQKIYKRLKENGAHHSR